jgi:iron(II)-dependent oxidoreductase
MPLTMFSRKRVRRTQPLNRAASASDFSPADRPALPEDPVERTLRQGRLGMVVAGAIDGGDPSKAAAARDRALQMIDEHFGLVPEGFASLPASVNGEPGCEEADYEVESFLLARHTVTNAAYQLFVDDGGYEELRWWPEEMWPHLINLRDLTDSPGPRYWRNSRHDRRLAKHPVVGVSFFEALAYARWAGFRLPTEPEWQMAASWRLRSAANVERRYPWGETLDPENCNIWLSGHAQTLPVDACPGGAAPNGVLQLIGNVWEWTDGDLSLMAEEGRHVVGEMQMRCIRGGAFDTYFPWQATSAFRSGAGSLARSHNIGFRCAIDLVSV